MQLVTRQLGIATAIPIVVALLCACGGGSGGSGQPTLEVLNGVQVPPAPDATSNAATLAGIDSNGNGIRDDIERRMAVEFGLDPSALPIAKIHASRLQAALVIPTTPNKQAYIQHSRCISEPALLMRLGAQTSATVNTEERRQAYRAMMVNVFVNREGC